MRSIRAAKISDLAKILNLDRKIWSRTHREESTVQLLNLSTRLKTPWPLPDGEKWPADWWKPFETVGIFKSRKTGQLTFLPEMAQVGSLEDLGRLHGELAWRILIREDTVLTAWNKQTLAGVVVALNKDSLGRNLTPVYKVFVDDNCRGRGTGTALMQELCDRFDRQRTLAEVVAEKENGTAIRLYERSGFAIDTVETAQQGFLFAKKLNRVIMVRRPQERIRSECVLAERQ